VKIKKLLINIVGFYLLATFCQQKRFHIRDSVFSRLSKIILQEYLSRKEIDEEGKMYSVFLKEGKYRVKEIF
jgi:hypothetical protein